MAANYDTIQTASWQPVANDAGRVQRFRALAFPEHWRESILGLCNLARPEGAEPFRTVPTHRFEQVIQAFAPDVLVMPRPSGPDGNSPSGWLYVPDDVPDPLPGPVLRSLVDRWLADLRPEREHRAVLTDVRAMLAATPPTWEPVDAELICCPPAVGGGAAPLPHQFTLSTDWLARRVLALGPYEHAAGRLGFRAVPRGPRDQGAELVSQPLPFTQGTRTWWYSIVLNITLHTVPFDPLPRFHLHSGVRRWATRVSTASGRVRLPFRRKSTVLLRPQVPYLPGAPFSERYALARMERRWDRETGGWVTDWVNGGPARILQGISLAASLPGPDEILSAPDGWLEGGLRAGIVHSTAMGSHGVKPGLMPHQRSELAEWAEQALPAELRATPPLVRTRRAGPKPVNAPPTVKKENQPQEDVRKATERRTAAAFALSRLRPPAGPGALPLLEVRLLWQTREMREAAVTALTGLLGLKDESAPVAEESYEAARPGTPVVLEWQSPELTVKVRCLKLTDGLAEGLPLPSKGERRSSTTISAAVHGRRASARSWLGRDTEDETPTLALVEIDRRDDFETGDHDPKFALRLGFADAHAVTQFVAVPKKAGRYDTLKNVVYRASMAWDDGLRQLGARVHPEHGLGDRLPDGLRYAAVWLVRKNRTARNRWAAHVPVAVLVTPQGFGSGIASVDGWDTDADDGAGAWIPYPAMLLKLTRLAEISPDDPDSGRRGSWRRDMEEQRRDTEEWLQQMRRSLRGKPTLLLAHGQNARSHWTWLQDGRVQADKVRDGHAPARRLDADLRLIRVRTARGRETAQWWGVNAKGGTNGLSTHLWVPENSGEGRVFYSTTPKPVQFKSSAVAADKLGPRPGATGEQTIDADKQGWSPGLVEIAVLGCHPEEGDDPESLALAVHQLRQPPDYPEALSLPLPLHLAGLGQEYVLPTLTEEVEDVDSVPVSDLDPDVAVLAGLGTEPAPDER
uniref:pPIWI_RE module domain-containing protein n=1 Tax=Herbidospora sakaeratensis TaxID=564415 RepID=UPI00078244C8|nr:DUF3962 domain-containing protein [Herbidospora sakaeratensis]